MVNKQESVSVIERIFKKYFDNLRRIPELDDAIIKKLQEIHQNKGLSDSSSLDEFIPWLEEYNAKNKKS